jgi:hypothetical protein
MRVIQAVELSAPAATILFFPITQALRHLVLCGDAWLDTNANPTVLVQFNGDSGANYQWHTSFGGDHDPDNGIAICFPNGDGSTADGPEAVWTYIPSYSRSVLRKVVLTTRGEKLGGTGAWGGVQGLWKNTSAITSLLLVPGAGNFEVGTNLTLYGMQ